METSSSAAVQQQQQSQEAGDYRNTGMDGRDEVVLGTRLVSWGHHRRAQQIIIDIINVDNGRALLPATTIISKLDGQRPGQHWLDRTKCAVQSTTGRHSPSNSVQGWTALGLVSIRRIKLQYMYLPGETFKWNCNYRLARWNFQERFCLLAEIHFILDWSSVRRDLYSRYTHTVLHGSLP